MSEGDRADRTVSTMSKATGPTDRADSAIFGDLRRGADDIQVLPAGLVRLSDPSVGATGPDGPSTVARAIAHRGRVNQARTFQRFRSQGSGLMKRSGGHTMMIQADAGACQHDDGETTCPVCEKMTDSQRQLLRSVSRLDELTPSTAVPIMPPVAYAGRTTLLFGREGSGKSTFERYAVSRMTRGEDFRGEPIQPVRTLWIGEERKDDVCAEFGRFADLEMDQSLVHVVSIRDVAKVEDLHTVIAALGVKLAIIDPLSDLVRLSNNNYATAREAVSRIWPRSPDVAMVGILHASKSGGYVGSVGQGGACDLLIDYAAPDLSNSPSYRELRVVKSRCRDAQQQGAAYYLDFDGLRYSEVEKIEPESRAQDGPAQAAIWEFLRANPDTSKTATARHFEIKPGGTAAYKALSRSFDDFEPDAPTNGAGSNAS